VIFINMRRKLWEYVRWMLHEAEHECDDDKPENLLTEPDEPDSEDDPAEEQSVVANIAGVTTPLGTGPTYPNKGKKRKSPARAAGDSFGGARPPKKS